MDGTGQNFLQNFSAYIPQGFNNGCGGQNFLRNFGPYIRWIEFWFVNKTFGVHKMEN